MDGARDEDKEPSGNDTTIHHKRPEDYSIKTGSFYPSRSKKINTKTHLLPLSDCKPPFSLPAAHDHKSISSKRRKLLVLPHSMKLFRRQADAIEYAKHSEWNICVFAYEAASLGTEGQRRYLAATFHEFAEKYREVPLSKRHVYEVIPENSPCRLYFDLEFKKSLNLAISNSDSLRILETFIQYIGYQVYQHFRITIDRKHVLDLDSSSHSKFSRHLIFHLPGAAFKNNNEAGCFVHYVCDQLRALRQPSQTSSKCTLESVYQKLFAVDVERKQPVKCPTVHSLQELFVKDTQERSVLLCDEAVYSKNRNFRIYLSSKLGCPNRCLHVATENTFKSSFTSTGSGSRHMNILMDSLVSYVRFHDEIRILTFDSTCGVQRAKQPSLGPTHPRTHVADGYVHSPFPSVDGYIVEQWTKEGITPVIRKWTYFPQDKVLLYEILRSRWCDNIQRHHKSNNVYIIVKLIPGYYYQKCYDPDCRRIDFKSKEYPIPSGIIPLSTPLDKNDLFIEKDYLHDDFIEEFLKSDNEVVLDGQTGTEYVDSFTDENDITNDDVCQVDSDQFVDSLLGRALQEFEQTQLPT